MFPRRTAATVAACMLLMLSCDAGAGPVRWTWTSPTDGGPVAGYQLECDGPSVFHVEAADTTTVVDMPDGDWIVRVRAWNLDPFGDRQYGPPSPDSDQLNVTPPPGGCGTPEPGSV